LKRVVIRIDIYVRRINKIIRIHVRFSTQEVKTHDLEKFLMRINVILSQKRDFAITICEHKDVNTVNILMPSLNEKNIHPPVIEGEISQNFKLAALCTNVTYRNVRS